MSGSHRNLIVWQKAMQMVTDIYRVSRSFPRAEIYGLSAQVRAAAVSVPSNVAEGKGRLSKREYVQFLSRALGSLLEVETQMEIAHNLEYLDAEAFAKLCSQTEEVGRMLNGLITKIQQQLGEL